MSRELTASVASLMIKKRGRLFDQYEPNLASPTTESCCASKKEPKITKVLAGFHFCAALARGEQTQATRAEAAWAGRDPK
jgi:hypothetical protein